MKSKFYHLDLHQTGPYIFISHVLLIPHQPTYASMLADMLIYMLLQWQLESSSPNEKWQSSSEFGKIFMISIRLY